MSPVSTDSKSEAGTIAALAVAAQAIQIVHAPNGQFAITPSGKVINLLPETLADTPRRKRATVSLCEAASFIDYVNAHKGPATHLFGRATKEGGSIRAAIDYHQAGTGAPGWGEHSATLTLELTEEFKRWLKFDREPMPQEAFAEFIEENMADIVRPDAADLIDVAQLLKGKKSVNFKSGRNLRNGAIQFEYSEEITATSTREPGRRDGELQVPDGFVLGIVPFVGAEGVEIAVRLRFRINNSGQVLFIFVLDRPAKVIEAAFELSRNAIEEKTGLKVHLGSAAIVPPPTINL